MSRRRRLAGLALIAAASLVAVGCGGEQKPAPPATTATGPAHDRFVAEVDAVCTKYGAQVDRTAQRMRDATAADDKDALGDVYAQRSAIGMRGLSALRAVRPPAGDADAYDRYVQAVAAREAAVADMIAPIRAYDLEAVHDAAEAATAATADAQAAARVLGVCS